MRLINTWLNIPFILSKVSSDGFSTFPIGLANYVTNFVYVDFKFILRFQGSKMFCLLLPFVILLLCVKFLILASQNFLSSLILLIFHIFLKKFTKFAFFFILIFTQILFVLEFISWHLVLGSLTTTKSIKFFLKRT